VKNNIQLSNTTTSEQGCNKKAQSADTISVNTENSSDNTQASTATTHIQNLKDEILTTMRQELASLLQADITPIHNEIKTV